MNRVKALSAMKWFLLFYGIVLARNLLESYLEKPHKLMALENLLFNYPVWFAALYLSIALSVSVLAGKKPLEVLKKVIIFSPIILIVPIIDFIASSGQGYLLKYLIGNTEFLARNYFGLVGFLEGNATIGQLTGGILALTAALFYVYEKTKSLVRVLGCFIVFYSTVFFYASFPSFFFFLGIKGKEGIHTIVPIALLGIALLQSFLALKASCPKKKTIFKKAL